MARRGHFTMGSVNSTAVRLALQRASEECRAAARKVVAEAAERVQTRAQQLAPKDTGFMAAHIRTRVSRGGYLYEVGLDESDFEAAGLPFYPIFVEWGTRKSPAQPFLFPAAEETRRWFDAEMRRELRAATRRAARRRR